MKAHPAHQAECDGPPKIGVINCALPRGCWESHSDLLEEQLTFSAVPSLQSFFNISYSQRYVSFFSHCCPFLGMVSECPAACTLCGPPQCGGRCQSVCTDPCFSPSWCLRYVQASCCRFFILWTTWSKLPLYYQLRKAVS